MFGGQWGKNHLKSKAYGKLYKIHHNLIHKKCGDMNFVCPHSSCAE
jgi:hypothetical protein